MFSLTFTFGGLPRPELSLNGRLHYINRSKLVKQERQYACYLGLQHRDSWKAPERAIISYEFCVTTRRVRDLENLIGACKAWIDGLCDAGILVKDDCWHLEIGYGRICLADREETRLMISATEEYQRANIR